jgi:hypothetical protein
MKTSPIISELERKKKSFLEKADIYRHKAEIIDKVIQILRQEGDEEKAFDIDIAFNFKNVRDSNSGHNEDLHKKYRNYDPKAGYKKKIAYVINTEGRFLSIREIASIIHELEPGTDLDSIKNSVSSARAILMKESKLYKYAVDKSNNKVFYGSKNWVDENGDIKPERMFSEDAIISARHDVEI